MLNAYTSQVLSFSLGQAPASPVQSSADTALKRAQRIHRAFGRSGKANLLLFGAGSGAVVLHLAELLPREARLVIADQEPEQSRAVVARIFARAQRVECGCDTSPWAHRLLWDANGLSRENTLAVFNPELSAQDKQGYRMLQALFKAEVHHPETPPRPAPSLCVGCILSPSEPGLEDFFAHIPAWVAQVAVVWDAQAVPDLGLPPDPRRTQTARPLAGNFAAQRNRMLQTCAADWVLHLDADERLSPAQWEQLPSLMSYGQKRNLAGYHLPRRTFYPDRDHAKVGFGLWPDLQLRLYRRTPELAFARPVHEVLTGLDGPTAVVMNGCLDHYNRLHKNQDALREKLAVFDAAGKGALSHTLSGDYPHLECGLLPGPPRNTRPRLLLLPASAG